MNKAEFLHEIEMRITGLSEDERWKSVDFFSEMIDERVEEGMTEEEAVESIGSVDDIAANIMQEVPVVLPMTERGSKQDLVITQDFSEVIINDINRDIRLAVFHGESCRVEYKDVPGMRTEVAVRDGCLHIEVKDERRWFDRISGMFKVTEDLKVYVPEKCYEVLRVRCVSGDIKLKDLKAKVFHIGSTNGDVRLDEVRGEEFHISTTNGDVKIYGDAEVLHVSTVNGDVTGVLDSEKIFHARTVTGDIRVPVSSVHGGEADISTVNGDIKLKVKG